MRDAGAPTLGAWLASRRETALAAMLEELKADVIPEAEAARRCGYDHSRLGKDGDGEDILPEYQEILDRHIPPGTGEPDDVYDVRKGRITNPTVHIGLNQLRRVVNTLIARHGKPREIAVELARDLQLSEKQKAELNRMNAKNTRDAEMRSVKLQELNQTDKGANRLLLKLWEELNSNPEDRVCIYSPAPRACPRTSAGASRPTPWICSARTRAFSRGR